MMRSPQRSILTTLRSATPAPLAHVQITNRSSNQPARLRYFKRLTAIGLTCLALYAAHATASEFKTIETRLADFLTFNFTGTARYTSSQQTVAISKQASRAPLASHVSQPTAKRPFFLPPHTALLPDSPATELKSKILEPATAEKPEPQSIAAPAEPTEPATSSKPVVPASPAEAAPSPAQQAALNARVQKAVNALVDLDLMLAKQQPQTKARRSPDISEPTQSAVSAKTEDPKPTTTVAIAGSVDTEPVQPSLPAPPMLPSEPVTKVEAAKIVLPAPSDRTAEIKVAVEPKSAASSKQQQTEAASSDDSAGEPTPPTELAKVTPESQITTAPSATAEPDLNETTETPQITTKEIGYTTTAAIAEPFPSQAITRPQTPTSKTSDTDTMAKQVLPPLPEAKPRRERLRRRAEARERQRRRRELARANRRRAAANKAKSKPPATAQVQQTAATNWSKSVFSSTNR